jgi:hypothetical protein
MKREECSLYFWVRSGLATAITNVLAKLQTQC